jgi:HEAT repeat protein
MSAADEETLKPALAALIEDPDEGVRALAANALRAMDKALCAIPGPNRG